jgi:adenosylcobinamide-phosphate synthase
MVVSGQAFILFLGLIVDWFVGDPLWLWKRMPHPVAIFGQGIAFLEKHLNREMDDPAAAIRKGAVVISLLIIGAVITGLILDWLISFLGALGLLAELLIVWIFIAQKSLFDHVRDVATGLRQNGLEGGRKAVALIVGRDPNLLDESGVSRAGIESLAENFCDGVVAPAVWYLVFGLPGLLAYKMINTADSMIAYRNQRYLYFGRATAGIDDLANWLPARLSALLLSMGGLIQFGSRAGLEAITAAMRDSGLHRSPNAGWPEGAMAGACGFALGGPRIYRHETVSQAFINGAGRQNLGINDIAIALKVYSQACFCLWGVVIICFLLL